MRRLIFTVAFSVCLVNFGTLLAADDKEQPRLDCSNPLKTGPSAVKKALGHLYHQEQPAEKLVEAHAALSNIVSDATNCRLNSQSAAKGTDGDLVREWISLHDWASRLADFVHLKSIGRARKDWEVEYADFAKLYKFDA
jgi:hypothetical protein